MDPLILTIVTRAIERLLVVLAGGLAIYLGYRLFIAMPNAERGSGKVNLPGGVSIFLSRVGPGVFFSLFGAVVIGLALQFGVSFNDAAHMLVMADNSSPAAQRSYSGIASASVPELAEVQVYREPEPYERDRVVAVVAALNRAEAALPADLSPTDRINLKYALRDARWRLLISIWDPAWGDAEAFRAWIDESEPDPPPTPIAAAVRLYRDGRAAANP
ncbi:MAG TPA: hypothetical protein VJ822_07850 [Dongiaceae bacterium]|nr:hypothetical protein [Dongiaceae bacterium]